MKTPSEIKKLLSSYSYRSAWLKGVREYAYDLLDELDETIRHGGDIPQNYNELKKALLNGAPCWEEYSWGGCSLIYDSDIAERLCSPSELKKTKNGERSPNSRESWLDVQTRALYQASRMILNNAF